MYDICHGLHRLSAVGGGFGNWMYWDRHCAVLHQEAAIYAEKCFSNMALKKRRV